MTNSTKKGNAANAAMSREMVGNVARLAKTVAFVTLTAIRRQLNKLKDKMYQLEMELKDFDDVDLDSIHQKKMKRYKQAKRRYDKVTKHLERHQ